MEKEYKIDIDDAIYFIQQITSEYGKQKPYLNIFKNRESKEYFRFIDVYVGIKHILSDRERFILDRVYALNHDQTTYKKIGEQLDITPERIRQITKKAEYKLRRDLIKNLIHEKSQQQTTNKLHPSRYIPLHEMNNTK